MSDEFYILDSYLEDEFKRLKWYYILATLDVCTNELAQTHFCDKTINDIAPL